MYLRSVLVAAVALAATFWICFALYRWGAGAGRDLWAIVRGVQRGEELDAQFEVCWRYNVAKRVLAAEVVAGRMSVREAAGHFRRLDEANPGFVAHLLPPPRDEWFFCESVLSFAWGGFMDQERYAAAARCYAEAFTAEPQLLSGPSTKHRYLAACAAARAGCGQGRDADNLDEKGRAAFRQQALDWLRAELVSWLRLLEQEPENASAVARDMQYWLGDPGLAGVRGPEALARLPAAERQTWQKLWSDVAATRARALGRIPPEPKAGDKIPLSGR
jgi:hypothetical protein